LIFAVFIPEYERINFFDGIDEVFKGLYQSKGRIFAHVWYWMHLIKSLPLMLAKAIGGYAAMLKNFIKNTLRGIRRQIGCSTLDILGLICWSGCLYHDFSLGEA
jgi:hypothetical protein